MKQGRVALCSEGYEGICLPQSPFLLVTFDSSCDIGLFSKAQQ